MSTPNALARFIKQQREAVEKSAAPKFEEITNEAVEIHREQPTFDNATVAEMRRELGKDVTAPSNDVTGVPTNSDLNPAPTDHNQANPGTEKQANVQSIIDAVRSNFGLAPIKSAAAPAQAAPAQAAPAKAAPLASDDLSNDVLAKVARVILETEEGCRAAEYLLEKSAGAADAAAFMREAIAAKDYVDSVEMHKAAAVNTTLNRAFQIEQGLRSNGITDEDAAICIKQAAIHEHNLGLLDHPMLKQAYAEGADDQAAMEASLAQGGEPNIPMGGEQLSEEELLQILQAMIASGEITAEEVQEALAQLGGGEGGAPAAEAAPAAAEAK